MNINWRANLDAALTSACRSAIVIMLAFVAAVLALGLKIDTGEPQEFSWGKVDTAPPSWYVDQLAERGYGETP